MRCVVCWFNLDGRNYTTATMIVNEQSVCDTHADVACLSTSINKIVRRLDSRQKFGIGGDLV